MNALGREWQTRKDYQPQSKLENEVGETGQSHDTGLGNELELILS